MTSKHFHGTGVALITPFKNGAIDYPALGKIIDHVIEGGVEYLVSLGTTGETPTLSIPEQQKILAFTVEKAGQRVPVVAGFGGNDTAELIRTIRNFDLDGVSAILSSSPAYNKPSQRGIIAHYSALADSSPLPVILYNVPGRTASNILAETTLALAEHEQIIGIKEASGNLEQATEIIRQAPEGFITVSGDDPTALAMTAIGGKGVISVIANLYPKPFSNMIRTALKGDLDTARGTNNRLFPVHNWLYVEGNPVGIKEACALKGLCSAEVRLPLVGMSASNRDGLRNAMSATGY
jgi:4-hydroxy-tetrahydrodipicolinate synthase